MPTRVTEQYSVIRGILIIPVNREWTREEEVILNQFFKKWTKFDDFKEIKADIETIFQKLKQVNICKGWREKKYAVPRRTRSAIVTRIRRLYQNEGSTETYFDLDNVLKDYLDQERTQRVPQRAREGPFAQSKKTQSILRKKLPHITYLKDFSDQELEEMCSDDRD